jgi:hypothetical protein
MRETRSAGQNGNTQDEENVAEDRASDRGLHDNDQSTLGGIFFSEHNK